MLNEDDDMICVACWKANHLLLSSCDDIVMRILIEWDAKSWEIALKKFLLRGS